MLRAKNPASLVKTPKNQQLEGRLVNQPDEYCLKAVNQSQVVAAGSTALAVKDFGGGLKQEQALQGGEDEPNVALSTSAVGTNSQKADQHRSQDVFAGVSQAQHR